MNFTFGLKCSTNIVVIRFKIGIVATHAAAAFGPHRVRPAAYAVEDHVAFHFCLFLSWITYLAVRQFPIILGLISAQI